ncbi:Hipothetical protein [Propionibacterium freudenreichii]|nr:Hipothetical protein [Propionibacterium freudenreichii]
MSKNHVAVMSVVSGSMSVAQASREFGISRQHVYRLVARYRAEGPEGLEPRSRAPRSHPNQTPARVRLMARLIDSISTGVPKALVEITKLGRTLKKRAADVLAYFDRPSTSNGPNGGDQRQARAPARLGAGVPQPDQLHRQIPARDRRVQTPTTPWIRMSQIAEQDYDLSINRYKEIEYDEVEHRPPLDIIADIEALDAEIAQGMADLKAMLG